MEKPVKIKLFDLTGIQSKAIATTHTLNMENILKSSWRDL